MKIQLLVVILVCFSSVLADKYASRFASFASRFGKKYASKSEEVKRFGIFKANMEIIDKLNEDFLNNKTTFSVDLNQFSDLTNEEFKTHLGIPSVENDQSSSKKRILYSNYPRGKYEVDFVATTAQTSAAPKAVDWTLRFTKLSENQGGCGSCAFFATAGTIDAAYQLQKNRIIDTSEEELYDCVQDEADKQECGGQHVAFILDRVITTGSVETKNYYPYTAGTTYHGEACRTSTGVRNKLTKVFRVEWKNEEAAKLAVSKYGVCITQVLGDGKGFQYYKSGIYNGAECRGIEVNHAVALVGYGTENGVDFWKIRNSWGPGWGEKGNGRILRNKGNVCGIAADVWCIAV
jgi:C1A family cysteine protease